MRSVSRAVSAALIVLVATLTAGARQQIASNKQPGGLARTRTAGFGGGDTPTASGAALTVEERRALYKALLQRRGVLKNYLATVSEDSQDYQATEKGIREIEEKLKALEYASESLVPAPTEVSVSESRK